MKKHISILIASCVLASITAEAKTFTRDDKSVTVNVIVGANDNGLTCSMSARKHTNSKSMQSQPVEVSERPDKPSDCFSDDEISSFVDKAFRHLFTFN